MSRAAHSSTQQQLDADLRFSADLVDRVEREAREATSLPWWFVEAGVLIVVIAVIASSVWPWGWAS